MTEEMDVAPFYAWIGKRCLVSPRVSGSARRLWEDYRRYCIGEGLAAERYAFTQALATELRNLGGLACGLCLREDSAAFGQAYPEVWDAGQKRRMGRDATYQSGETTQAAPRTQQRATTRQEAA